MSELLDKQVNAQKENLKKYFQGSRELPQAHKKMCDEMKVEARKNDGRLNIFVGRKEFIRCVQKARVMDNKRLQVNEGTICYSKRVNRCQKDGFLSVGARTGAIKLVMAGT